MASRPADEALKHDGVYMTHYNVVVGAGHAGVHATSLIQGGYAGSIALLSAENVEPYAMASAVQGHLAGEQSRHDIRPSDIRANSPVDLQLGAIVTSVDPEKRVVTTDRDRLFTTTTVGGRCRGNSRFPEHGWRSADVDRLRAPGAHYEARGCDAVATSGLEVAASAPGMEHRCTFVEAQALRRAQPHRYRRPTTMRRSTAELES